MLARLLPTLLTVALGLVLVVRGPWWLTGVGVVVLLARIATFTPGWWHHVRTGEAPAPQPPAEYSEPGHFAVVLADAGPRMVDTIKAIRDITDVGLLQAKDWAAGAPCPIAAGLSRASADRARARLERAGATAQVHDGSVP